MNKDSVDEAVKDLFKKAEVHDKIKEIFEREAPIATEKHADMILGEIARLFWR